MREFEIKKLLEKNNLLVTKNRIEVIKVLSDNHHFHAISEIIDHIKNVNIKSVYNTIKILIKKGLVDSHSFGGVVKYAISDNLNGYSEIHIIDGLKIKHLEVEKSIFKSITDIVEKEFKKEVKSIKIFVDIK